MELICPSCGARYQLPEGAITARGRQVSCMNCGHSWHARPPIPLADPVTPAAAPAAAPAATPQAPSDPRGIQYVPPAGAPGPDQVRVQEVPYSEMGSEDGPTPAPTPPPPAAPAAGQAPPPPAPPPGQAAAPSAAGPAQPDASRSEQMAEIRQMLAEVQSEDGGEAGGTTGSGVTQIAAATAAGIGSAADEAERARARLQEEREQAERAARKAEEAEAEARESERDFRRKLEQKQDRTKAKPTDVKRLRKKHDRKVSRHKRAAKAGSGAFLTGFLMIAIIAATMVAMYRLQPQIVERMPNAEQPMREYVATMDRLREGAKETVGTVQKWLQEKLGDEEI